LHNATLHDNGPPYLCFGEGIDENDGLEETLEFAEWIGEYRLRERLLEKADILRAIRFAN